MVRKDITFIYSDSVEKQVYEMIAKEAEARGYKTRITDDKFCKCEIGWYCQHINFPQYSKFSIIMLHDITQQYGYWPDIWYREPWNKYDIGFLPNKIWAKNWYRVSDKYYTRPRKGIYLTGWPKADRVSEYMDETKRNEFKKSIGINPNIPTILYAPAWENDGKQDDFVQAMLKLNVNILIKQAPWSEKYAEQIENIRIMYEKHKNNPRVIQMDPKTNILDAIMISDVLVSEESSTMLEAVMMGKPAVSVTNWLIPDRIPSRYPSDDYEFTINTKKENLTECIEDILNDYESYQTKAKEYSSSHCSNIGNCIPMMLDILDARINGTKCHIKALRGKKARRLKFSKFVNHILIISRREISHNYCERNPVLKLMYKAYNSLRIKIRKLKMHQND